MSLDFLAGCLGGCCGVLVGHPFDTIKVHLQTQDPKNPIYRGTWHCMKTIVINDSIRGLYRGITSPMTGVSFVNAIVFGIYGNVQRHTEDPESLGSHFLAGSVAGLLQSVVCAPMELAKTRIQLQHEFSKGINHKGPLDCLRYIIRTEGLRGVFKGLVITAMRDVPGFSSYFVSYELMMRQPSTPTAFHSLLAGGFAGIFSWLASYPLDVIKTCVQADGMSSKPKYTGAYDCMIKGYQSDGLHFFFRGLSSTLIRAFPMNAACFFVVSWIMKMANNTHMDVVVHSSEPLSFHAKSGTSDPKLNDEKEEIEYTKKNIIRSFILMAPFNKSVCEAADPEMENELYSNNYEYYILKEKRIRESSVIDKNFK